MNDLTSIKRMKINASFVEGVTHQRMKRKSESIAKEGSGEVTPSRGLEVAAGLALGVSAGKYGAKKLKDKMLRSRLQKGKRLEFADRPLKPLERYEAEKVGQARKSIRKFKQSMRLKDDFDLKSMPQGVDMLGEPHEGRFVKAAKQDIPQRTKLSANQRRLHGFNRPKGMPIKETRRRVMNRVFLQEALGDMGADSYFHRKKKGAPVTLSQEMVGDLGKLSPEAREKAYKQMQDMHQRGVAKGVILKDVHMGNLGANAAGGHSVASDLERITGDPKIRKAVKLKDVMSTRNKKLTMKYAKEKGAKFAKGLKGAGLKVLPWMGPIAAALAYKAGDAEAAFEIMDPSGSEGLTPQTTESKNHFAAQEKYNALRRAGLDKEQSVDRRYYDEQTINEQTLY